MCQLWCIATWRPPYGATGLFLTKFESTENVRRENNEPSNMQYTRMQHMKMLDTNTEGLKQWPGINCFDHRYWKHHSAVVGGRFLAVPYALTLHCFNVCNKRALNFGDLTSFAEWFFSLCWSNICHIFISGLLYLTLDTCRIMYSTLRYFSPSLNAVYRKTFVFCLCDFFRSQCARFSVV